MADGSIRIGTKIDTSGLKRDIKEIERELNRIRKEQAQVDAQADAAMQKFNDDREFDSQFPEEVSHREDIDRRAAEELDPIIKKQEELNAKERETVEILEQYKAKLAEANALTQAGESLNSAIKGDKFLDGITTQEQYNSLLEQTKAKMASIEAHAKQIAAETGVNSEKLLASNGEYQKLSDRLKILTETTREFKSESESAGKKASKSLKQATNSANSFGTAIKGTIKKIGKMALAIFGIRGAFNAMRRAATAYLESNEELKNQMDSLWNIAGQAIGPVIEYLVRAISTLVSWVNTLVEALWGINLVAKANAAALKKQGAAAKDAASVAGFDEMNKLSDSSGGGSSAGVFDESLASVPAFMEKIKELLLEGDWYGAGKELAESITNGIADFDWDGFGEKLGEIIGGIFSFSLGLALNLDPITIAESAWEFATGLFTGLSEAIQGMDWGQIGGDIVDFLVKSLIAGILYLDPRYMILGLIFTPKGKALTSSVSSFVGSIIGALASAFVGAAQRLGQIGIWLWETLKSYTDEYVDWEGTPGDIIAGLYEGIKAALKDIGDWVYENIWIPFRDGFKESFDINSPSKKMEEFGVNIIDGLCNGITENIDKVKEACKDIWEAIKDKFANVGGWFETTFSDAWQKVKDVFSSDEDGTIFSGIKEGIEETFKTIVNGLITGINKVITTPFNKINNMLNTIRSTTVLGIQPFINLWGYNPLTIPQIPKLAVGGIVNRPGRGVPAIIGEAGAEAVLPLENNTEWMDILAEKIGGNVTIPITLDGKRIATYVVDIQKKKAFAVNGV